MRFELKEIIAAAIPYFVAVAAAYLFGYWGSFNINILEYVSLADLAKLSVYPLLASLVFILVGILISELLLAPSMPPGGGANSVIGRLGRRFWRLLLTIQVILIIVVGIFGREPWRWFAVATLVAFFSTPLSHVEWFIDRVPHPRVRATAFFLLLFLPGISFAYGRLDAFLIKDGRPTNIVDVGRSGLSLADDLKHPVSYLGFVGGTYVLFESRSGQVVFLKQQDGTPLYVTPKQR